MELLLWLLLPSTVLAAISVWIASKAPLAGSTRLLLLALSVAGWFAPVVVGVSHGAMPMPLGTLLFSAAVRPAEVGTELGSMLLASWWLSLGGVVSLTLVIACLLRLLFSRWALRLPHA
jgi:hypothetical protein